MSIRQIATELSAHSEFLDQIVRGDPIRIAFVRVTWTGNIGLTNNTFVSIPSLAFDTSTTSSMQASVFDTSQLSAGLITIKREGIVISDVVVRPGSNFSAVTGRIECYLWRQSISGRVYQGGAALLGDYTTSDLVALTRVVARPADTYRFDFRWMQQVTTSFSLGFFSATLIWLPGRY